MTDCCCFFNRVLVQCSYVPIPSGCCSMQKISGFLSICFFSSFVKSETSQSILLWGTSDLQVGLLNNLFPLTDVPSWWCKCWPNADKVGHKKIWNCSFTFFQWDFFLDISLDVILVIQIIINCSFTETDNKFHIVPNTLYNTSALYVCQF